MATTRLALYNNALLLVGERALGSLSENREPRRLLDQVWDSGAVRACLQAGLWNFAIRSMRLESDPDIEPDFSYSQGYAKPDDWVRTAGFCSDELFNSPVTRYSDEAGYWFADLDEVYVQYVSDDIAYGNNLSLWPESFTRYVECYLATRIVKRLTQNGTDEEVLKRDLKRLLADAKNKDAQDEGAKFLPPGGWAMARRGGWSRRRGWR